MVTVAADGSIPDLRPKFAVPQNNFERITESPEALSEFLRALPVLSSPWNEAFYRYFCDNCPAENCDECSHTERDNPLWWLGLPPEADV